MASSVPLYQNPCRSTEALSGKGSPENPIWNDSQCSEPTNVVVRIVASSHRACTQYRCWKRRGTGGA